ncbi:MAG: hypothetical protein B6226_04220 [Candidatus Cloacimonetes bacterium 4572_65]|nr:MAG: hypothetical protein B6226_04220 [Candidatus Cloacimonetes bacterium 4572_65]
MRVVIIEDEQITANRIKKIIENISDDYKVEKIIESVEEGIEWFEINKEPDLIFSDIQLGDGTSFEIFADNLVECPIIFITAFNQYAINAFKLNSIEYLLKPVKKADIALSIKKYEKVILSSLNSPIVQNIISKLKQTDDMSADSRTRFLIKKGSTLIPIEAEEIAIFFVEKQTTYIITKENKKHIIDESLDHLEENLDKKLFFRVSRQQIIQDSAIAKIHQYFGSRLLLDLKFKTNFDIVVSRRKVKDFKDWYEG